MGAAAGVTAVRGVLEGVTSTVVRSKLAGRAAQGERVVEMC